MNKPIAQLDLVPATTADAKSEIDQLPQENQWGRPRHLHFTFNDEFDWSTDDSVVVKPRPGVAVYENKAGDVVIRTQGMSGDEDHFAFIAPEGVPAVIRALKAYAP
jgi:hypothetical protein